MLQLGIDSYEPIHQHFIYSALRKDLKPICIEQKNLN